MRGRRLWRLKQVYLHTKAKHGQVKACGQSKATLLVSAPKLEFVHAAVSFLCYGVDPPYVAARLTRRTHGGLKRLASFGTSQPKTLGNEVLAWAASVLPPAPEGPPWRRLQALPLRNLRTFG